MDDALKAIVGRKIERANSSLTSFAIGFDDNSAVIFDAVTPQKPSVAARIVTSESLPQLEEAVCSVDWSWICGSTIGEANQAGSSVRLSLKPAGPLAIGSALWQGQPFLSFQPFKPVRK